ncbi:MAG TPA: hypothetical protein VNA25_09320, partial [Phycisphaerae bacterium]|nr:hypothetical protein [Phycisphaerae bacterium]
WGEPAAEVEAIRQDSSRRSDRAPTEASEIHGHMNAFVGRVLTTYYGSTHPELGTEQGIYVEMVDVLWDGDNIPTGYPRPQTGLEPTPTVLPANPWPPREDQVAYHVKADDIVTVLVNDDGQAWYTSDELPFIGAVVQDPHNDETAEAYFGGAANTHITVRRVQMSGDPQANPPVYTFSGSLTTTTYHVRPMTATGQHHGYRVADPVVVWRRGLYFYCVPASAVRHAVLTDAGPASEADHTNEHYWAQVTAFDVAYSASDASDWDWDSDGDTNLFIVDAVNLGEVIAGTHTLTPLDGTLHVLVFLFAGNDGTKPPYWVFQIPQAGMIPVRCWRDGPEASPTDGDEDDQCNRTYTVRTLAATAVDTGGVVLGTAMSPVSRTQASNSKGTYHCPPVDGTGWIGVGYLDHTGTFYLFDSGERPWTTACDDE